MDIGVLKSSPPKSVGARDRVPSSGADATGSVDRTALPLPTCRDVLLWLCTIDNERLATCALVRTVWFQQDYVAGGGLGGGGRRKGDVW